MLKRKLNKKGFTLAELLIVVAIIAILVAIAVPVFSSQLEKSREAVDRSNARSANSMAVSTYQLCGMKGKVKFSFKTDDAGNMGISAVDATATGSDDGSWNDADKFTGTDDVAPKSKRCTNAGALTVTVENGAVDSNTWLPNGVDGKVGID